MENQNFQNQSSTIIQKKRGRPRKNFLEINKNNEKKRIQTDLSQEREIILHLPISLNQNKKVSSDSDKNKFTAKDSEDDFPKSTILTISENITEQDDDNLDNTDISELLDQLKNKDRIIKKLREEISIYKANTTDYNTTAIKENKYIPMNINLIDNNTGKSLIVDKTNLSCWWCTYSFDSMPCFIPERFDNDKYYVFGCFCTFNCAASYNLNMGDYKINDRYSLIKKLYQYLYDTDDEIIIAPTKEVLEKFGGPLSIIDYRKNFKYCNKEYKLLMPPMVPIIPYIEERNKEKSIINKNDTNKYDKKTNNSTIFSYL